MYVENIEVLVGKESIAVVVWWTAPDLADWKSSLSLIFITRNRHTLIQIPGNRATALD